MLSEIWTRLDCNTAHTYCRLVETTGISPNALTAIGFALTVIVAGVLAGGYLLWGGLLLIFAALFDTLDGALARHANKTTVFGAFFDSVMDRFSESVTLIALIYYYSGQPDMGGCPWCCWLSA